MNCDDENKHTHQSFRIKKISDSLIKEWALLKDSANKIFNEANTRFKKLEQLIKHLELTILNGKEISEHKGQPDKSISVDFKELTDLNNEMKNLFETSISKLGINY